VARALLVIDIQNEYFTGKLPIVYPSGSFENILRAIDISHDSHIPVVVIQHTALAIDSKTFRKGSPEWELHPEIASRHRELLIEKNLPGSFTGTTLEKWLRDNSIDTLTICGYMTQMCCDTTARQAMHLGFSVEFLSDATGTIQLSNYAGNISAEDLHRAILVVQAARFSKVMTTGEWLEIIDK
jgi:nicotinamidase-related amidase